MFVCLSMTVLFYTAILSPTNTNIFVKFVEKQLRKIRTFRVFFHVNSTNTSFWKNENIPI
uniref:Uncharacterized protein n=1 Tax=Anguilla anguilla TaxID=7936 RepID=A0A0E9WZW5_ANGAN